MTLSKGSISIGKRGQFQLAEGSSFDWRTGVNEERIFHSSSRKTFIGGMIKAAHFLQGEKFGILVFVIVERDNVKVDSIAKHLLPYFEWIKDKTGLYQVYVISTNDYYVNGEVLLIDSLEFQRKARPVNIIKE